MEAGIGAVRRICRDAWRYRPRMSRMMTLLPAAFCIVSCLVGATAGAVQSTRPVTDAWSLIGVGTDQRSLLIRYPYGWCERRTARIHLAETARTVTITVRNEESVGDGVCPAIEYIAKRRVQLAHPLAGRRVLGAVPTDITGGLSERAMEKGRDDWSRQGLSG